MRHVLYISGSRADYGPARHMLRAIQAHEELSLSVLVTGMHLDPAHGRSVQEVVSDGFHIAAEVKSHVTDDSLAGMAQTIGHGLSVMSREIERIRPDIVLVLGDRGEQLAAAIAAAVQNITIAHLCGGSLSGSIDDSFRHAITKFAHFHFPASEEHAARIRQMGEDPQAVRVVGMPGGDLRPDVTLSATEVRTQYGMPQNEPYLLVIQHSVTHSHADIEAQITETLEAVAQLDHATLLANPNNDSGGRVIMKLMRDYAKKYEHLIVLPPPNSRELFASIMAHCAVLIGNSSSAVSEAMSIPVPVVNVGERQRGREHLACWISVDYDRDEIQEAIRTALGDNEYNKALAIFASPLVRRNHAEDIAHALANLDLDRARQPKNFVSIPYGAGNERGEERRTDSREMLDLAYGDPRDQ